MKTLAFAIALAAAGVLLIGAIVAAIASRLPLSDDDEVHPL